MFTFLFKKKEIFLRDRYEKINMFTFLVKIDSSSEGRNYAIFLMG